MKKIFIACAAFTLIGCSPLQTESGEQFYTWVDASGQIRTAQRPRKNNSEPAEAGDSAVAPSESTNAQAKTKFDTSSYRSSEVIDKHLDQTKLFSWQQDGRIINEERTIDNNNKNNEKPNQAALIPTAPSLATDYSSLLEQTAFIWEQLKGRELNLFKTYTFNKELNADSILIELEQATTGQAIIFSSYVQHKKIALPKVIFLDDRLKAISAAVAPFSHFIEESWNSYAYMQGVIEVARNARYLLLLPSEDTGFIELDGTKIKMSDQGHIMFKTYNPDNQ